jgi:hypothetical protein
VRGVNGRFAKVSGGVLDLHPLVRKQPGVRADSTGPAHHPQQDLNTPSAVTKLDVQEVAQLAIKNNNGGQARFADQIRVGGILAGVEMKLEGPGVTGQPLGDAAFPGTVRPHRRHPVGGPPGLLSLPQLLICLPQRPPIRLHDLRHGWATLALQAGVHPKVVQERLGHANIGITLDTYSHVVPGLHEDAAEQVAALF